MDCAGIGADLRRNENEANSLEDKIKSERGRNQAAGIVAVYIPPAILAANGSEAEMRRLDDLQAQRDRLRRLQASKGCRA